MGKLIDKLTGRAGRVFPAWEGEVHDAICRLEDIVFDPAVNTLGVRCWRWVEGSVMGDSVWEELLIEFAGLTRAPTVNQQETLPYYEIATIYFDPSTKRMHIRFHAGLSIEYATPTPNFLFRGRTGQRRNRSDILNPPAEKQPA